MLKFCSDLRLGIETEHVAENPHNPDWQDADHWKVIIRRRDDRKQMTVYFSQGYGHNGKAPKLASVLDCLASDSSGIENARSFEDWAEEYGYDPDSRKAERIYKACASQAKRLKQFLGEEEYETLLWKVERE